MAKTSTKKTKKDSVSTLTMFDILKDIITVKSGRLHERPDFDSAFSRFVITRYLFCSSSSRDIAFIANGFSDRISNKQMYQFLVKAVPFSKNSYIKYIK